MAIGRRDTADPSASIPGTPAPSWQGLKKANAQGAIASSRQWISLIARIFGVKNERLRPHIFGMEKIIVLSIVASILIFAGTYALSVANSYSKGR